LKNLKKKKKRRRRMMMMMISIGLATVLERI
jgi:predicted nucleic acid-binding Zn ribbon protein